MQRGLPEPELYKFMDMHYSLVNGLAYSVSNFILIIEQCDLCVIVQ